MKDDHDSAPSRALKLLADLNTFSRLATGLPLRPYQAQPAHAILQSILRRQGLASWLSTTLGPRRVTGFDFAGRGKKARLGSAFLSLIETGRFKYWAYDPHAGESQGTEPVPMTDGWWFWRQTEACAYEVPLRRPLRCYAPPVPVLGETPIQSRGIVAVPPAPPQPAALPIRVLDFGTDRILLPC